RVTVGVAATAAALIVDALGAAALCARVTARHDALPLHAHVARAVRGRALRVIRHIDALAALAVRAAQPWRTVECTCIARAAARARARTRPVWVCGAAVGLAG